MQGAPPPPSQRVPPLDWDRPPWNRWSFQRMSELLPTTAIRRGQSVSALPEAHQDISAISFNSCTGKTSTVEQLIDDTYTDGLLIILDGRIIHESYYNGMQRRSLHLAQSVSKSIVATAASTLFAEALIDPAAPITSYLPELTQTAFNGATVQQVLDMTTGVRYNETYEARDSDVGKTDVASGWKPAPADLDTSDWPQCLWDQILQLTTADAGHGSRFEYHSIDTEVLAMAMARVTGCSLQEVLSTRLWAPMGAEEDANITVDPAGCGVASGGVSASLRDFARFGLLLLNEGVVDGRQVIPQSWVNDIRHGKHGLFNDLSRHRLPHGCYRNQFWIEDDRKTAHLCLGVFGQMIYVSPERNMVAAKLSTWPTFLNDDFARDTLAAFHAVGDALDLS